MGIPKFFRYISERYPLTSQLITENKIPEFDNLYLDFNSIIHNCSHPNDGDAHFRLSEEQIFTSIFAYVDHLFVKIKPKKFFFIAVDGIAPRAKMNQQRSRRFRTAKEAKELREKAERNGEELPAEKAFDSNCITPGTPFMARLSDQLNYFINQKITSDSSWSGIQVILSGHSVPGEGEHKIMEYIRLSRAQPDYNPNIRHCLYGLDADLIMLGLCSHDPHFCLLREEVKFGPSKGKKNGNSSLESINFYLLHLSLMREYLNLEFQEIEPTLPFKYNLERVIDDFILLAVFVGNDFLPNLPDLHIHENGLEKLFEVYKKVLPGLGGYINDRGTISVERLQVVLDDMREWEREVFEREYEDINWYKGKQTKYAKEMETGRTGRKLALTERQKQIFDQVKSFVMRNRLSTASTNTSLTMPNTFPARDRKFIAGLAGDLHLEVTWDEYDAQDQNVITVRLPGALSEPVPEDDDEEGWEDVDDEGDTAVDRVLRKYQKAPVVDDDDDFDERHEKAVQQKMDNWKRDYYKGKLGISYDDPVEMQALAYRYVEGLQWVMHYYYSGVASWGWFYNYHYAPRISDLRNVKAMAFDFELGKPFHPYEQLMGVLPVASMEQIPSAYQDLMHDPNSPILDFYPLEFEQDLNGKKAEWEAIVKIPFIDEKRLLKAMASREHRLTLAEKERNTFGTSTLFSFNHGEPTVYPSSLPGFFPSLTRCTCKMEPYDLPTLDGLHLIPGLCDGVLTGSSALAGFPSLNTLPHTTELLFHGVNIHGTESRNRSIVVRIENPHEEKKTETIAEEMIGNKVFVGWPFLQEGLVVGVSDSLFKYQKLAIVPGSKPKIISDPHASYGLSHWKRRAENIESFYSKKLGVVTGGVDVLVHVRPLKGLKRLDDGAFVKDFEEAGKEVEQAVQMTLAVASEDPRFAEKDAPPLSEEFPEGSKIFFLGEHAYGVAAQVSSVTESTLSVILAFFPSDKAENEKFKSIVQNRVSSKYFPSFKVSDMVGLPGRAVSKITSSFMVITSNNQKQNLGLNLKFEGRGLKVINYSKKDGKYWEFSEKAVELIRDYKLKFPELFQRLDSAGDDMARASDVFPGGNGDARVNEVKAWLKSRGVRDFEPVPLFADQLSKDTVSEIERFADTITANKSQAAIKKAIVKGIPRQAVLKPSHAVYRLKNQNFALGDRVTMVQDSGGVPLSIKGVVVGLDAKSMDIVWDFPFISGTTMGDRCSPYRGSTVEFGACLNLTNPQFTASTNPKAPTTSSPNTPFKPRFGPYPAVRPPNGQPGASGFRPPTSNPMYIMNNPNRGRGGSVSGRGGALAANRTATTQTPTAEGDASSPPRDMKLSSVVTRGGARGGPPRGGFSPRARGRGFAPGPNFDRGRGGPGRGFRGRGRGGIAPPVTS